MTPEVTNYIFGQMQRVPGRFRTPDALIITAIARAQQRMGIRGSMAEIGVFYGRSYYLLSMLKRPEEGIAGIDLFAGYEGRSGEAQLDSLVTVGGELGVEVQEDHLLKGDSATFTGADVTTAVGPVRMFSIDGGHHLHHLAADCAIADAALSDDGVIVFDDYANDYWPEVTVGMFDFLRANADRYAIFCVSARKLYACRRNRYEDYVAAVFQAPEIRAASRHRIDVLSDKPVHCRTGRRAEWGGEILDHCGLSRWSRFLYR